jgi:hypothetical protein
VSRKPREGIDSLDAVLARIDAHFQAKRANAATRDRGEVVIIHDFEATAPTFAPIIDRLAANGARFSLPSIATDALGKLVEKDLKRNG